MTLDPLDLVVLLVLLLIDVAMLVRLCFAFWRVWRTRARWGKKKLFFLLLIITFFARMAQNLLDLVQQNARGEFVFVTIDTSVFANVIAENAFFSAQCLVLTLWAHHLLGCRFQPSKHNRAQLSRNRWLVSIGFGTVAILVTVECFVVNGYLFSHSDNWSLHYGQEIGLSVVWGGMAIACLFLGVNLFFTARKTVQQIIRQTMGPRASASSALNYSSSNNNSSAGGGGVGIVGNSGGAGFSAASSPSSYYSFYGGNAASPSNVNSFGGVGYSGAASIIGAGGGSLPPPNDGSTPNSSPMRASFQHQSPSSPGAVALSGAIGTTASISAAGGGGGGGNAYNLSQFSPHQQALIERRIAVMNRRSWQLLFLSIVYQLSLVLRACSYPIHLYFTQYRMVVVLVLALCIEILPTLIATTIFLQRPPSSSSSSASAGSANINHSSSSVRSKASFRGSVDADMRQRLLFDGISTASLYPPFNTSQDETPSRPSNSRAMFDIRLGAPTEANNTFSGRGLLGSISSQSTVSSSSQTHSIAGSL